MFAPHERAIPADQHGLGVFFPGAAEFFRAEAHGNGGYFARASAQVASQLAGGENDVQELGAVQIIEILRGVLHFISLAGGFVNKSPDGLGVRDTQSRSFTDFLVTVQTRITHGNEVLPAQRLAVQRSSICLATTLYGAELSALHS